MPLTLSFASGTYDRMRAIHDGRVKVDGVDLNCLVGMRVEEIFFRQARYQEFDIAEFSLSAYLYLMSEPNPPLIAIPVFPSRMFRHQSIYVNSKSGIKKPEDLRGKTVSAPEYGMTAIVWQRGILREEYGVGEDEMKWKTGTLEPAAVTRPERVSFNLPDNVSSIAPGKCLSHMLAKGEIDAIYTAPQPSTYDKDKVVRLFPNFKEVETDYYKRTGIHPIMHVVVIKRSLYEKNPWLAKNLMKAFAKSMELAREDIAERAALAFMLPWLEDHLDETRKLMGNDYWVDGFDANRHVIDKFCQYSYEQGLARKRFQPEELFARETLETFAV
ncbi:4,5-dihydroxyphthalate decarboxylase [Pleurostoma richardsiae]|uniref:4,5-dihydroxyphthalate decarboxylase n=1 Tax=Pleurostoma richardsiae TaxID=41990 RepID=A0AA38REG6_9PEZI|nr:4,5-dihydroxyphthalate decarboxylase [Pleurostoma richardsiae]